MSEPAAEVKSDATGEDPDAKFTSYQKKLFLFLSVATFFEGYDFLALSQILPNLREDMGLAPEWSGYLVGIINGGTVLAFFLVRQADRIGRKRMLTITIAGYTIFTFATGFAPDVVTFAICQVIARIFLIAEWAVSMVIAAEEFPAAKRGFVIGVVQGCSSLGSVFCAGVVPLLLKTGYEWRAVYFVGILPLLILGFARRGLKETKRFEEAGPAKRQSLFRIWKTPYRNRMLVLALIWMVAYVAAQNSVAFWKDFALNERGWTDDEVGLAIMVAALVSMPMVFYAGRLIDKVGRRHGAAIIFTVAAVGTFGCYTFESHWALTAALIAGIFGASAYLPVLNSYNNELFPTELRADAFAWSNNLLGRLTYVGSPFLVGFYAGEFGGYGPVVPFTAIFPFVAIALIYGLLPETKGRSLEDTAALG